LIRLYNLFLLGSCLWLSNIAKQVCFFTPTLSSTKA
jgi:hypothetical protein